MRKIIDGIAIAAGAGVLALIGAGTWGYFWATSEDTHQMLKDKAIEAVKSSLPIPGGKMVAPKTTGGALPLKSLPF